VISASIFYMALATAYTLPLGYVIEFALPFLVAVHLFGRLGDRFGGVLASATGRSTQRTPA
jgi:hypothetical protein